MANFKGGFAFNNEAAKVEVEQSPNGALISCINPVTGESMGGGNPNSVQVITGTLANPFGDVNIGTLYSDLLQGNANAEIKIDLSALGITPNIILPFYVDVNATATFAADVASGTPEHLVQALIVVWQRTGVIERALRFDQDGIATDIITYASSIPTTLTIYWHPMP